MSNASYSTIAPNTAQHEQRGEGNSGDEDDIDVPVLKRLTSLEAAMALMKGNLGPGCLNLPHAFALSGYALGGGLFLFIALQGIYSMWLLVYCKNLLIQREHESHLRHHHMTFMHVAHASLGELGGRLVEVFLFVLQGGVCCVFLSLISTNLEASFESIPNGAAVAIVAITMLAMVLLRFIKDLVWLCTTANCIMLVAIMTASIAGIVNALSSSDNNNNDDDSTTSKLVAANPSAASIITFTSDMFFAFEGIGLVLPIENSYQHPRQFPPVLIKSMSTVAVLFASIGVSASVGFPEIRSGSVTAFLEEDFPSVRWYSWVNSLVMVAVALTFPLQLTPAMEVLDKWLDNDDEESEEAFSIASEDHHSEVDGSAVELASPTHAIRTFQPVEGFTDESHDDHADIRNDSCGGYTWVIRRWITVIICALIVVAVDDLGILMSLFGAIGQTGLAAMPCAIHLALQKQGVAPRSTIRSVLHVIIISFCAMVMVTGFILAFKEIIQEQK